MALKPTRAPSLTDAIRGGGVREPDARGLMPLETARAIVRRAAAFQRGEGRLVDGAHVLDSDRLWAALVSLEDGAEFVREASRLEWRFHPRGRDNVDLVVRYGAAILPWLRRFVRARVLINVPWCVAPCLVRLDGQEVFDVLWGVSTVAEAEGVSPPGEPDMTANLLVIQWLWHDPATRFPLLALRAETGDPRANLMLMSLAQTASGQIFGCVRDALGEARAAAIFARARAPRAITAAVILAVLDGGASQPGAWPVFDAEEPHEAYFAMRLLGLRAREGDGWWIVFERVEGSCEDDARVRPFVFGGSGAGWNEDACRPLGVFEDPEEIVEGGVVVVGPRGPITVSNKELAGLSPDRMTAPFIHHPRHTLLVRAYLAHFPDAFWIELADAARELAIPADADVVVHTTAWSHPVSGRPSESAVLRSLAEALAARDPARFTPGEPNTDWRLYATYPVARLTPR